MEKFLEVEFRPQRDIMDFLESGADVVEDGETKVGTEDSERQEEDC